MRKYFRTLYYISGILLFVILVVVGYTQTNSFKNYLRQTILKESQKSINGVLKLGPIGGNLVTGFTFDSVSVDDEHGNVFSTERIELKLDLLGFPFKRIAFSNAVIVKPYINIYRTVNGKWNIESLIKKVPDDTLPSAWSINIKRVKLADAEVFFIDSLLLYRRQIEKREVPRDSVIDYARIHLCPFTLVASAEIQHGRYQATVRELAAAVYKNEGFAGLHAVDKKDHKLPVFIIKNLSGDFLLTKEEASARNVRIETQGSRIRLDAGLNNTDITEISDLDELKYKPVDLFLVADGIDTRELKQFLYPPVNFLDNEIKIQLKAYGTFETLNIEQLAVQMRHSFVQLHGQLRNLHRPNNLEISANFHDSYVSPSDMIDHFPGLKLPDLSFLGNVKFELAYEGRPLDFKARFIGSTTAGNIDLDGKMKIDGKNITYSGKLATGSIDLEKILPNSGFNSSLNTNMTFDGAGFNPRTMTGLVRVEIDSSQVNGLPVQHSVLVFDIADGLLRSHVAASVGSGTYELSSQLKFCAEDSTAYNIVGRVRSLDLAEILQDRRYRSACSFDLTAAGSSGTMTRLDTSEFHFLRSTFDSESFESAEAKVVFSKSLLSPGAKDSLQSALNITSTIGNISIDGNFTLASFIAAWRNSYQLISEGIAYRYRNLDSLRPIVVSGDEIKEFRPSYISGIIPIDAKYRLFITDLKPIGVFFHIPLAGYGTADGRINGDSIDMRMKGKVDLKQFSIRTGKDTLSADTASLFYLFSGINRRLLAENFQASLEPKLYNFEINGLLFNGISGKINISSDSSYFKVSTFIDSTVHMNIAGISYLHQRTMGFKIQELNAEFAKYSVQNADTVQFSLCRDGLFLQPVKFLHEDEEASVSGYFSPTGVSDLSISVKSFFISNLKQILHRGLYAKTSTQFGGVVNASSSFRGSLRNPSVEIDLKADNVRADDISQNKHKILGKIDAHLSYSEYMLKLLMTFRSNDEGAQPDLLLSGSLPYEFVLVQEAPHELEGEVDLTLKSTGMNLEFLDPFIPEISNLSGMMTCDMQMKGPIKTPEYAGTMSIQNANFVFNPLGLRYILNGNLIPVGDKIQLDKFTIENDPRERKPIGTLHISGDFALLGLKFKRFDLLANGELKVMTENKRMPGQKLYGNLFAATGSGGLEWKGDLSSSLVKGEVFIKDAQLVLPPEREVEFVRLSVVQRTFNDDTSEVVAYVPDEFYENNGKIREVQSNHRSPDKSESASASSASHSSFLDGINYDISIETQGSTQLRFVFNTQTSEELFADLRGRLYFNKTPEMSRMTGQVEVGDRSYYNFIKKFEAKGKLLFTGDVLNPELEILGTFQGIHHPLVPESTPVDSVQESQVLVTLEVTGNRNEPKTRISLQTKTRQQKDWRKWDKGDEEANAISYIVSGQFRDELTDQQRMGLIGTNLGLALATGMVTGPLSDALRRTTWGYIQSVDVIYNGGQFDQAADLRLTGQVGEAVIRAGGRVLNDIANANVSVELPVSTVVKSERYRNLILTLERRVDGIQSVDEQRRASNGIRLFYRITF